VEYRAIGAPIKKFIQKFGFFFIIGWPCGIVALGHQEWHACLQRDWAVWWGVVSLRLAFHNKACPIVATPQETNVSHACNLAVLSPFYQRWRFILAYQSWHCFYKFLVREHAENEPGFGCVLRVFEFFWF
jgi:hypothetical protein